jgi:chromosome segregation ATPase
MSDVAKRECFGVEMDNPNCAAMSAEDKSRELIGDENKRDKARQDIKSERRRIQHDMIGTHSDSLARLYTQRRLLDAEFERLLSDIRSLEAHLCKTNEGVEQTRNRITFGDDDRTPSEPTGEFESLQHALHAQRSVHATIADKLLECKRKQTALKHISKALQDEIYAAAYKAYGAWVNGEWLSSKCELSHQLFERSRQSIQCLSLV